jgi:hypothetical protein
MAIAFVRVVTSASNSFAVDATGANLLVVIRHAGALALSTSIPGTYNGVALTNITNGDNSVQAAYLLNPASGSNTLAVTADAQTQQVVALLYSGAGAFLSVNPPTGAGGVANNNETTTTSGELLVPALTCTNTSGTANTGTTERYDSGGVHASWVGDRICGAAGSYNAGVTTASGTSIIIPHFSESTGASLTVTAAFVSGAAAVATTATKGQVLTASFVSGVATVAATVSNGRSVAAAFVSEAASFATAATVTGNKTATASFVSGPAAADASVAVAGNKTLTASFVSGAASMAASAVFARTATAAFRVRGHRWQQDAHSGLPGRRG